MSLHDIIMQRAAHKARNNFMPSNLESLDITAANVATDFINKQQATKEAQREKEAAQNLSEKAKIAQEELTKANEALEKSKRELHIARDQKAAERNLTKKLDEQKQAVLASREANGDVIHTKLKIKAIEDDIRDSGGKILWIETSGRPLYESTERFYKNKGYALQASLKDFYATGDPKQIYSKVL